MPADKKNSSKAKTREGSRTKKSKLQPLPKDADREELIRTRGKEAFETIANLAIEGNLKKEELRVKCLLYLADLWAKNARKNLENSSDFEATLANIARRAAEKYDRKQKQRKSGQGG